MPLNVLLRPTLLCLLLLVAACSDSHWQTTDISGMLPTLAFTLTDENGDRVTADTYSGRANLMFFGFTHCAMACPTTLSRLGHLLDQLPASQREAIEVLFVSVDPDRDTAATLATYTDHFGADFIGLTGTQAQLRALNKRYRATYGYGEADVDGNYSVSHSAAVYGFAPGGAARVLIRSGDSDAAVLADLQRLATPTD